MVPPITRRPCGRQSRHYTGEKERSGMPLWRYAEGRAVLVVEGIMFDRTGEMTGSVLMFIE
jgi:hypothetical protein